MQTHNNPRSQVSAAPHPHNCRGHKKEGLEVVAAAKVERVVEEEMVVKAALEEMAVEEAVREPAVLQGSAQHAIPPQYVS